MADAVLPHTGRLKQTGELGELALDQRFHPADDGARLGCRLDAGALAHDGHKLFGIHVPNHVDGRVLRGFAAVVPALPVVALALHEGLSMDVAAEVYAVAVRDARYPERELQGAYGAVPGFEYLVLPLKAGRGLGVLADCDKGAGLAEQPVVISGVFNQLDVYPLSPRFIAGRMGRAM